MCCLELSKEQDSKVWEKRLIPGKDEGSLGWFSVLRVSLLQMRFKSKKLTWIEVQCSVEYCVLETVSVT